MKKALNLLLGLLLLAPAYAKSPAFIKMIAASSVPCVAILPPAPISSTGSIALTQNADDQEYVIGYDAPYIGTIDGYPEYDLELYFYLVDYTTNSYTVATVPNNFTVIDTVPINGTFNWPEGTSNSSSLFYGISFSQPLSGNYDVTTTPTVYDGIGISQIIIPTSSLP